MRIFTLFADIHQTKQLFKKIIGRSIIIMIFDRSSIIKVNVCTSNNKNIYVQIKVQIE